MNDESELLVELLEEVLGKHRAHYESKGQISFNCPSCDEGRNKGNFEVNYFRHVYKCWSCSDDNGTHGPLGKLFDTWGSKKQKRTYSMLAPEEVRPDRPKVPKIKLPPSYTKFKDSNPRYPVYKEAMNYLRSRFITDDMIEKYDIGFCDKGDFMGRIIIPSYDHDGQLNYYIARSWNKHSKSKYRNPDYPKDEIIFNESRVDWGKDIFLVEGVFDALFLDNAVVMLGKHLSQKLMDRLYNDAKGKIIIALDGDAWKNALSLYHELNGGKLFGRIEILKLPEDRDIAELQGNIGEYYYEIK